MKNPYLRSVLIIGLVFSFLYTLLTIFDSVGIIGLSPMLNIIIVVIGFPAFIFVMFLGLLGGMIIEFIGPLLVFAGWFIVLYLITNTYSKLTNRNNIQSQDYIPGLHKVSNKTLIFFCSICVFVFSSIMPIYFYNIGRQELNQYKVEESQTRTKYTDSFQGSYLSIPELGIKFKLPSNLTGFKYSVVKSDSTQTVVGFSTDSLSSYKGCTTQDASLGVLVKYSRNTSTDVVALTHFLLLDAPREYNLSCSNGCGYHPYSPYTLGNYYYFYTDPFEMAANPSNPGTLYYNGPTGYLSQIGSCSTDMTAQNLQKEELSILKPALSTVTSSGI